MSGFLHRVLARAQGTGGTVRPPPAPLLGHAPVGLAQTSEGAALAPVEGGESLPVTPPAPPDLARVGPEQPVGPAPTPAPARTRPLEPGAPNVAEQAWPRAPRSVAPAHRPATRAAVSASAAADVDPSRTLSPPRASSPAPPAVTAPAPTTTRASPPPGRPASPPPLAPRVGAPPSGAPAPDTSAAEPAAAAAPPVVSRAAPAPAAVPRFAPRPEPSLSGRRAVEVEVESALRADPLSTGPLPDEPQVGAIRPSAAPGDRVPTVAPRPPPRGLNGAAGRPAALEGGAHGAPRGAGPSLADREQVVEISIGRVELHAPPPPAPPPDLMRGPTLTLDAYLAMRQRGSA